MDSATCLHSSSTSHTLLPILSHRPTIPGNFLRLSSSLSSNARHFSRSNRSRRPLTSVSAQAKRAFSPKEDKAEVASPADLQFEVPLKIVEYPDPILRAKNKRIGTFDDNLKKLVLHMFDVMYKTDGIGLSAPQVGLNVQLMVFNSAGERGVGEEIVLVNPRVYKYSRKTVPFNEGCLSFPGIYADVERPESIKVDARDIRGARFTINLSDLDARVFQHEFDHLQEPTFQLPRIPDDWAGTLRASAMGILFFDRMTEEVIDGIRTDLQALEKKYEERTGSPSPERIETRKGVKVPAGFGKS